jgi:excisionase family DNA binding protein
MIVTTDPRLTPSQAARELGLSSVYIRALMDQGRLAHEWTPLGRLIPREAVEAMACERKARQVEPAEVA